MFEIQKTKRLHSLIGCTLDGKVMNVPNILCVRKHMETAHKEMPVFLKHSKSKMFAFVSSPGIVKQQQTVMNGVKLWCHPFKNYQDRFTEEDCQFLMMPESDFMDIKFVSRSTSEAIKYDFFYMTIDSKAGFQHKGLRQFVKMLPILCGSENLRGVVIVYFPASPSKRDKKYMKSLLKYKKIIDRYSDKLTFLWGWQKQNRLAKIMASCKFGFFPNTVDCSPRLIPECLLRDRPILLNKSIWGGWHYINDNTGAFFDENDKSSLRKSIQFIMSSKFEPSNSFMSSFGFIKSSNRLANFLSQNFEEACNFTHIYFKPYQHIMQEMVNKKEII